MPGGNDCRSMLDKCAILRRSSTPIRLLPMSLFDLNGILANGNAIGASLRAKPLQRSGEQMKRIMSIAELGVNDIPIAGGKAANLGELTAAGFKVPGGFVLTTTAYDYFLEKNDLLKRVGNYLEKVDVSSESSLQDVSAKIRRAFDEAVVPR